MKRTAGFIATGLAPALRSAGEGFPIGTVPCPPAPWRSGRSQSGRAEYAEEEGIAVAAKPVMWKGRVAKVAVVAVPAGDRAVLAPQLGGVNWHRQKPHGPVPGR